MQHLALIMDGNRRWAKQRLLRPCRLVMKRALRREKSGGILYRTCYSEFSLYAFSLENFRRAPEEVNFLFELFVKEAYAEKESLKKEGVCVKFIGDRTLFPAHVLPALQKLEESTAHNTKLFLQLLFCYGSQQEITATVKKIAAEVKQGTVALEDITPEFLSSLLWTGAIPAPELIIRTGGKKRLSNFLLYQAAYSELCFLDCLWPDLQREHLVNAVKEFQEEQRNFGT